MRHARLKIALNRRQVADIERVGPRMRTRAQCALTHFDEGGIIVVLRDRDMLAAWDAHDWHALFWRDRAAWTDGRAHAQVFGHALLEHALHRDALLVGKALVLMADAADSIDAPAAARAIAAHVENATLLTDPQELRPLPLSGLPGWHRAGDDERFFREAACFRPLREGRRYPAPMALPEIDAANADVARGVVQAIGRPR
jgi:hypothetical protein